MSARRRLDSYSRIALATLVTLVLATAGCRSGARQEAAPTGGGPGITATVLPSPGDAHLALLPAPVQLMVQVRPPVLFADPTLSLAAGAFLTAMSSDSPAAVHCMEQLSRTADVVTYAWIGGRADGWIVLVDAALDGPAVASCVQAFGVTPPPEGVLDPPVGGSQVLGADRDVVLARLGPTRRALGLFPTVEAVRAVAALPAPPRLRNDDGEDVLSRLRQGDLKLFADLDELAVLGADSLPFVDDADRVGLLLRLETMRADSVTLVHARSAPAGARLEEELDGVLSALRRAVLDEPGVSAGSVYHVFDDAVVERLGSVLRVELAMDRPTLSALVGLLAHRALPRLHGGGRPPVPPIPPPDADAGAPGEADAGATDSPEAAAPVPADAGAPVPAEAGSR